MKKIGREVLFLHTSENNPRNGEGTFARLADGRILYAYTQYYSTCGEDHGTARICCCVSEDEGETWSPSRIMIEMDAAAQNIMSPALVEMRNGRTGIFYLRKEIMPDGGLTCMPCFRYSDDGGETWSEQCRCSIPDGYYCGINDGAVFTKSGRLLWPMSYHGERYDFNGKCTLKINHTNEMLILYSDDGVTWGILPGRVKSPFASTAGNFAEPGVYEHEDGTLWMWMRTGMGHQYDTLSTDGGETWLSPEPNLRFPSPDSPMRVKRLGNVTAAVFNPVPYNPLREDTELWQSPKRTPIAAAFSSDDDGASLNKRGASFVNGGLRDYQKHVYLLEDDTSESYCYPSMIETRDGFLVSYYHSAGTSACLRASRIVRVKWEELR